MRAITNTEAARIAAVSGHVSPAYVQNHFAKYTDEEWRRRIEHNLDKRYD